MRRWLDYAREDLLAAEGMVSSSHSTPRHACFLAQQAAEKALKAVMIFLSMDVPLHHNLNALRNLLPNGLRVKEEQPDLGELTTWAITGRYPTGAYEATMADAQSAVQQARAVWESVLRDLARHGFDLGERL